MAHNDLLIKIRIFPLVLATLLSAVAVPGCSLFSKQSVTDSLDSISGKTPWYETSVYDIDSQYADSEYDYVTTEYLGSVGGESVYKVSETSLYPSDFDWENGDYKAYNYVHLDFYSKEGLLSNSIDIREKVNPLLKKFGIHDASTYDTVNVCGDKIIYGFPGIKDSEWHEIMIDPSGGESKLLEKITPPSSSLICRESNYWTFGDDAVAVYSYLGYDIYSGSDMVLAVNKEDGIKTVSFAKQTSKSDLSMVEWMIKLSDGEYLFKASAPYGLKSGLYILNTDNMSVRSAGEAYEWVSKLINVSEMSLSYDVKLGTVMNDKYGLAVLDFEKQQAKYIFRYDYCNINRYDVPRLKVASYSDEKIVFAGDIERSSVDYLTNNDSQIVVLDLADTNPNAGKDVIRIAVIGKLDYASAQACYEYNAAGNDCYAVLDERYIVRSAADDNDSYLNELSTVESLLAVDMNAGDGPDIILNAAGIKQFNNSAFLTDLSSCIPEGKYFDNVFNAFRSKDGAIYQMPLTCGISGISTNNSNVKSGTGAGLTFEEYPVFLNSVCNGDDPFDLTRLDLFCLCIENMSDCFFDSGEMSFDNDEFRKLAAFVDKNISDPLADSDESLTEKILSLTDSVTDHPACYTKVTSFSKYLQDYKYQKITPAILGMPSQDGRGPGLVISDSVAVNAKSKHTDACLAFVSVMLSPSVQECYAKANKTPVNMTAFETSALKIMDAFNLESDRTAAAVSDTDLAMNGLSINHVTHDDIKYYESLIAAGDHLPYSDSAVMLIIREEIQPYLAGQKSIDDVTAIIENRVATVKKERG